MCKYTHMCYKWYTCYVYVYVCVCVYDIATKEAISDNNNLPAMEESQV